MRFSRRGQVDLSERDRAPKRLAAGGDLGRERHHVLRRLDPDGRRLPRRSADRQGRDARPGASGRAAIGIEHDRGRIFVAGGTTGKAFVYDARSGALQREIQLATGSGATFVNDVAVTRRAAYFTDSNRAVLYRVGLTKNGAAAAAASALPLTGDFQLVGGFNLNGIDATPDGKTLVVVQSATGKLFRVDAATGVTQGR